MSGEEVDLLAGYVPQDPDPSTDFYSAAIAVSDELQRIKAENISLRAARQADEARIAALQEQLREYLEAYVVDPKRGG